VSFTASDFGDDDDRYSEAQEEAAAEAYYDRLYSELGPEWAREHAQEIYEENYGQAVEEFTSERMQSYYLSQPTLATPARGALLYARSLIPAFRRPH
jgi:hypothetical protein